VEHWIHLRLASESRRRRPGNVISALAVLSGRRRFLSGGSRRGCHSSNRRKQFAGTSQRMRRRLWLCVLVPVIAPSSRSTCPFSYASWLSLSFASYKLSRFRNSDDTALCSNESASNLTRSRRRINSLVVLIRVGSSDDGLLGEFCLVVALTRYHRTTSLQFSDNRFFMNISVIIRKTTKSDRSPLSLEWGIAELEGRHACLLSWTTACFFFGFSRFLKSLGTFIVTVLR